MFERMGFRPPFSPAAETAEPVRGTVPADHTEGPKAMAGSLDAVARRRSPACGSLSPSCSWLLRPSENH